MARRMVGIPLDGGSSVVKRRRLPLIKRGTICELGGWSPGMLKGARVITTTVARRRAHSGCSVRCQRPWIPQVGEKGVCYRRCVLHVVLLAPPSCNSRRKPYQCLRSDSNECKMHAFTIDRRNATTFRRASVRGCSLHCVDTP